MGSELAAALAKVQAEIPPIAKGETGEVKGVSKDTGRPFSYTYQYADLADVTAAVLPLLGKHGLAFTAWPTLDDGKFVLAYALLHESGEERTGIYPLPSSGSPQQIGGVITYARRYCLLAVTGAAPGGEDNDAAGATEVDMDRTRTRIPGPDHERLRHPEPEERVNGRNATRSRAPAQDDPWLDQPAGELAAEDRPGSAHSDQVRGIQMAYQKLGFKRAERAQAIATSEQLANRPLTGPNDGRTHNNLSFNEARKLKDTLEAFGADRGALVARLAGATREPVTAGAQDAPGTAAGTEDGGEDG